MSRYFFSSTGTEGGAFVATGGAGVDAGGCVGVSPRIPSLNSRTPCPSPFITSGILRPPKSTRITTAMIRRCIGLSHMGTYLSRLAHRAARPRNLYLRLQYNTLIPGPPRHVLAVQVLQQRNGVLAADSRKLFECSNRQPVSFFFAVFRQEPAQLRQRLAVKDEIVRYLHEHFFSQQYLQNFLRPCRFDRQLPQHGRHARHGQSRALEFALDHFLGARLIGGERNLAPRALHQVAGHAY